MSTLKKEVVTLNTDKKSDRAEVLLILLVGFLYGIAMTSLAAIIFLPEERSDQPETCSHGEYAERGDISSYGTPSLPVDGHNNIGLYSYDNKLIRIYCVSELK